MANRRPATSGHAKRNPSPSLAAAPCLKKGDSGAPRRQRAACPRSRERGQALVEARRQERRREYLAHLGGLAAAQRALALQQRVPLRVESLADQCELALARLELRLAIAERPFAFLAGGRGVSALALEPR